MPKVVGKNGSVKKFPYTPKGEKAAAKDAKKTGGKMEVDKSKMKGY